MFRIAKLTDYGILLMTHLANEPGKRRTARELTLKAQLPSPTVVHLLKELSRGGLLASQLGAKGGYSLARPPEQISVAQIITLLEGPVAMTECGGDPAGQCNLESSCMVRGNWQRINGAVLRALGDLTLADMARPLPESLASLRAPRPEAPSSLSAGENP